MKASLPSFRRAFTLLEVLIAMTICGFAMAGIMTLFFYTIQNNYVGEQRLLANNDVRFFTEKMISNARASNILRLYKSFYAYTPANNTFPFTGTTGSAVTPFSPDTPLDINDEIGNGQTGDFLVFISYFGSKAATDPFLTYVSYSNAQNVISSTGLAVSRLVLYWIAPNRDFSGENAMYMYDSNNTNGVLPWNNAINLSTGTTYLTTTSALEALLPNDTAAHSTTNYQGVTAGGVVWAQIVLNDVRGLSADGSGLNFTNYTTTAYTSVLMKSLILHGNAAKRVTDTYDFTITPGG